MDVGGGDGHKREELVLHNSYTGRLYRNYIVRAGYNNGGRTEVVSGQFKTTACEKSRMEQPIKTNLKR